MYRKVLVAALFVVGVFADEVKLDVKNEQFQAALTAQCNKVNAPEGSVTSVTNSIKTFLECIKGIVDPEQIKKEIEEAKPNGALDEVFKKYCAKTPEFKTCIHNVLDASSPCLDETSKAHLNSAKNGTDQLIDFICYKDGDRIALFIAEHGPECIGSKQNEIRECVNTVKGEVTVESAKQLTMAERCGKYDELAKCVVEKLETCDTPTPGNMAESLFKYVRKSSPCNDALPPKKD